MKTVAAIATAPAVGGIGIVRISGDDAISVADAVFKANDATPLASLKGYRSKLGEVYAGGSKLDNCIATVFRAPRSYTGEDVVELSCHGSQLVLQQLLRALFAVGASPAPGGEFTKRAFLNGKLDLTQAEAVQSLIASVGEQGARASLGALDGALKNKINAAVQQLLAISAQLQAWVDYPDEEIPDTTPAELEKELSCLQADLEALAATYDQGQMAINGIETVIAGRANAGKSTLMNLLCGKQRSIVTDIAGTTRDVVETTVNFGSLVLRLADTAGIRQTADVVESIGVERALEQLEKAQLVFAVFDLSQPLESEDMQLIDLCRGKTAVAVINKNDLKHVADESKILREFKHAVYFSAKNSDGVENLLAASEAAVASAKLDNGATVLANERQLNCVKNALASVSDALSAIQSGVTLDAVTVCIDDGANHLLELTGEKATDSVVDEIFKSFCVGK